MPSRSGGRYTVKRGGKPVLVERTGYRPASEAVKRSADTPEPERSYPKQETPDADA